MEKILSLKLLLKMRTGVCLLVLVTNATAFMRYPNLRRLNNVSAKGFELRPERGEAKPLGYSNIEDDSTLVMDTEARRKQRLDRLNSHSNNSRPIAVAPPPNRCSTISRPKAVAPQTDEFHNMDEILINAEEELREQNPLNKISEKSLLGKKYLLDNDQNNSILSAAPAILMESGAGTGKTTVLAGRAAHLLRTNQAQANNMIIMSFTKRDASALKEKALEILFDDNTNEKIDRESVEKQLWSGTIHSFATSILRKYNNNDPPLRIVSSKEVGYRIKNCLGKIDPSNKDLMFLYKSALEESNQSRSKLINYVMRCLELWKEAGMLSSPYVYFIKFEGEDQYRDGRLTEDDYVELSMRLGIPQGAAALALCIVDEYQTLHASMGTADPSDVAMMAYDFLMSNPDALNSVRLKLQHVILDEYQDVSVSQHKLLRLILLGADEEEIRHHMKMSDSTYSGTRQKSKIPILVGESPSKSRNNHHICYHVPKITCAGDGNQSIYGWRGAAPSLTVDGFRQDFPQGVVVSLGTSFRLTRHVLNAANVLLDQNASIDDMKTIAYDISPAAAASASSVVSMLSSFSDAEESSTSKKGVHSSLSIGQKLLLEDGVMSENRSSVFIQGLWDQREEAKYIATDIRKTSKERVSNFSKALKKLSDNAEEHESVYDSTDVAIMVRSKHHLRLIKEALNNCGIPFAVPIGQYNDSAPSIFKGSQSKILPMKPVKLITMHKAKGDEFDVVYLAGWTEGVFPHPSTLESNRLLEERRIAYVALTRARQRVVITYSFIKRVPYYGSKGEKRYVTEQVEPSRFLYDLMDASRQSGSDINGKKTVEWSNSVGFKEVVAGKNLPEEFASSYRAPTGFTKNKPSATLPTSPAPKVTDNKSQAISTEMKQIEIDETKNGIMAGSEINEIENESKDGDAFDQDDMESCSAAVSILIGEVENGIYQIFNKERGACKRFQKIFRAALKDFGVHRGRVTVLTKEGHQVWVELRQAVDALAIAPSHHLTTRPLSRCTSLQLGLYLIHILDQEAS